MDIFSSEIEPLLTEFCHACHNAEDMTSGVNLQTFDGRFADRRMFLWRDVLKQIESGAMPPEMEVQPSQAQREQLISAISKCMNLARAGNTEKNGTVRRLTVSQYRNTLRDLLGLKEDFGDALPPDGVSKLGFTNNSAVLGLSPLQLEYYLDIAEEALSACIIDADKPVIQKFRVDLGRGINLDPCPDRLILGANSRLLNNADILVSELSAEKPFDFTPYSMQKSFRFVEGYTGNGTNRGWREFEGIYHAVFACMRGSDGYPLGEAYGTVPEGLLLRPAIPSSEIFGESSTYGPMSNFKVSLRELPQHGNFRIKVTAAKYNDALLLAPNTPTADRTHAETRVLTISDGGCAINVSTPGIYKLDIACVGRTDSQQSPRNRPQGDQQRTTLVQIHLDGRSFGRQVELFGAETATNDLVRDESFMLIRLPAGEISVVAECGKDLEVHELLMVPIPADSELGNRFVAFEQHSPLLGVSMGLRRDCGHTLKPIGAARRVSERAPTEFIFEGAINDFPRPHIEEVNVNYLAGFREIGVRNEYTDGRDVPRLLVKAVEFEGPYYESWPPKPHRRIFVASESERLRNVDYAREIVEPFITRAYRRPATQQEVDLVVGVWQSSYDETADFNQAIKDALLVALTSPQFLMLSENSESSDPEPLDDYELASKLSYFLWNRAPDEPLLIDAADGRLHRSLHQHVDRMIDDTRFKEFVRRFTDEWLAIDKFAIVEIDRKKYPKLTRDTKRELAREPAEFLHYLFSNNLPLQNIVDSDFVMANEAVAAYYELREPVDSGFDFVPVPHGRESLGGLLTQASILSGLSNGSESNPVKRGAWFARKMIADPPDDPPPNVPDLEKTTGDDLTLRERLEAHRNQEGCVKCHSGIDPWGIPFEAYDAGGLLKAERVSTNSTLPDGTEVANLIELKRYLESARRDRVAYSFLKHLSTYAVGRTLSYNELVWLEDQSRELQTTEYRLRDLMHTVVCSDIFLTK